jgi:hypothetical protein
MLSLLAFLTSASALAQQDLGTLHVTRGGETLEFRPNEQPEYKIWTTRKGEERLMAGWRHIEQPRTREIFAQFAGLPEGTGPFGLMIAIQRDGHFRNYSTGCSPDNRRPCDPASFGLSLDLEAGTVTLDNAEFKRNSLDDGPDADERIRASGTLRLIGQPVRR